MSCKPRLCHCSCSSKLLEQSCRHGSPSMPPTTCLAADMQILARAGTACGHARPGTDPARSAPDAKGTAAAGVNCSPFRKYHPPPLPHLRPVILQIFFHTPKLPCAAAGAIPGPVPEYTPPQPPSTPGPTPLNPPGRPLRPDESPQIPDPDQDDPIRNPDKRREQTNNPDGTPEPEQQPANPPGRPLRPVDL